MNSAAGLIALRDMTARLGEDHERARLLAAGIAAIGAPYDVDPDAVGTNILFVGTGDVLAKSIVDNGAEEGVLLYATGEHQIRFVTHHDVDDHHVERLLDLLRRMGG